MKERWLEIRKGGDFQKIGEIFGIDPVIARIIRNREIIGVDQIREYLQGDLDSLPSFWLLKDMDKAVEILRKKIRERRKIRIIGDYDVDGVTSTYILLKGLRKLGADVDTYIPDRIKDGYGMNENLIKKAEEDGIDTLVTCDNGISAYKEIALAKKLGLTTIVTDHHEIPFDDTENGRVYKIPCADAVINPKQKECRYPNKNICGAVVAWKLIGALYEKAAFSKEDFMEFLEFAAIATIGDVMSLQGENRLIVKAGLKKIPDTTNYGLKALIEANHLEEKKLTSYSIGFVLGPCINASGRLDKAARALELLLSEDAKTAARLAGDLVSLNQSRKELTELGKEEAMRMVDETEIGNERVLVVYLPECHESLAGIIAGKVREKYYKPTFVLTKSEDGIKGSGRSIDGYSMYEELVKCKDILGRYGGHTKAAGLSLKEEEDVKKLRKRLNENCTLTEEDLLPKVWIDARIPFSYITKEMIEQISLLEPFGPDNKMPLFGLQGIRVLKSNIVGKNHNVTKLQLMDESGTVMDAIYFGEPEEFKAFTDTHPKMTIAYYPQINCYMGVEKLQIVITNYC